VNSEELELSLRTEFESYLKTVLADMRREATEFQNRIEGEFRTFAERFDADHQFDEAFRGSVAEHLRLARDEGAKITANAMAEAEKMDQAAAPAANYDGIRDAVTDISSKDSQSAILKSLVHHAAAFAPRGAFFIIKNDHLVGWKVFGTGSDAADGAIREIHFPSSSDSILGSAVRSLATVESTAGAHADDATFLGPLQFDAPDQMYAIPLVARGRSVAVLYADNAGTEPALNREALETLVRVAGLTVELLASSQTAKAEDRQVGAADFEDARLDEDTAPALDTDLADESAPTVETRFDETIPAGEVESPGFAFGESVPFDSGFESASAPESPFETPEAQFETAERPFESEDHPFGQSEPAEQETPAETHFAEAAVETDSEPAAEPETVGGAMVFDSGGSIEPASFERSPFDKAAEEFEPAAAISGGFNPVAEPVAEATVAAPPQARLSDRPVDLPIEVPDDERRIHNDARRFARLLVSEIKLYNEKKVIEGREARDLYDRLREAIDRSREMYDKRVQPPVAAKFDYFHYEIVNALAEGDSERLGPGYPGSSV